MAHPNVVFMGVCGCGKSTVARRYAAGAGYVVVEADDFHPPANVAKMRSGQPLTDEDRAGWLAALAARISEGRARGETMVLTCSALKRAYRDRLRQADPDLFFVHLAGSRELARKGGEGARDCLRDREHSVACSRDAFGPSPELVVHEIREAMRHFERQKIINHIYDPHARVSPGAVRVLQAHAGACVQIKTQIYVARTRRHDLVG